MKILFITVLFTLTLNAFPQCEILNRIYPDGTVHYYIEPVNFYWTEAKSLKGGIITDKESFFLALQPVPFPPKPAGHKLKDNLELKLANDSLYILEHFDTRYMDRDSIMQMLFLIEPEQLEEFLKFQAISVKINMGGEEGLRSYTFKLHKDAIQEQLDCFLKEEEKMKKTDKD